MHITVVLTMLILQLYAYNCSINYVNTTVVLTMLILQLYAYNCSINYVNTTVVCIYETGMEDLTRREELKLLRRNYFFVPL